MKIYAFYLCILFALSVVEMKPLYINGRVGENVTIKCSDWNVITSLKKNVKYLCDSPCLENHHIIIKAAYGETTSKNRLELYNGGKSLFVTFTNLQKSDSKTYVCGLERLGFDSYIKVILNVTDAHSPSPKTTPKTVIVGSTLSFTVTNSSTMSSNFSDIITETSTARSVPYLVIGVIAIITILMVLLKLMSKMMKKQLKVVSSADTRHKDTQESAGPDEVYQSLHPLTLDEDQVYSTLTPTKRSAGPDEVDQSLHPLTLDEDQVYSTLTPTERV